MELPKMKLTSASGSEINLEALYQICPSCFTEVKDEKTGELTHKINFSTLRELLGDNAFEGADEEYGFNWVGKNAARREAARVITKTLRPCPEESVDWVNTQNLYIEGDNLEVLKLLQKSYLGKIKMIYIDPPYNTGNDFVYRDDFAMSADEYEAEAGNIDDIGNRYRKNTDSNARFHSDWCSMIYERLLIARSLMSEDGVIFISIDDNEVTHLKKICDEIFSEYNFIANIVRNTNSTKNQSLFVSVSHEYCLIYSKNIDCLKIKHAENKWSVPKNNTDEYLKKVKQLQKEGLSNDQITEELKTLTKYPRFIDFTNYWYFDERGLYRKDNLGGVKNGNMKPLFNPLIGKEDLVPPGGYRYNTEKLLQLVNENRIHFHTDGSLPTIKRYLHENEEQRPKSIMSDDQRPDYKLLQDFELPFDNPKQLAFMERIIGILDNDSIILDFFSGSATTAHAIMKLNSKDTGSRKFIMVQLPEQTEACSEAYKAGYKNICEIGKERIRRAGKKIKDEAGLQAQNLDIGFRVFKCEDSFMNDVYFSPAELKQEDLFSQVENIKDGTSDLSMLFGCMLDWGVQLSLPLSDFTVSGKRVYNVNDGDLVACFAEDVNEDVISAIAELSPLRVVFRDSCFKEAAFKMNLFELFKQKCGWSEEQVKSRVHVI